MLQEVILVDESDNVTGKMEKMEVHRRSMLHRAFSVFIFNCKNEMLLQKRATNKYHSGGLWTNTCCSHPSPGEQTIKSAARRLNEEMGFSTNLEEIFHFIYKHEFENGLTEYEFDHVFIGYHNGEISPNKEEVCDYCFMAMDAIENLLMNQPQKFSAWFQIAFPMVRKWQQTSTEFQKNKAG
ncbi:MAG TPA: isopentenyl-diphosphate Delta-isomerase [Puia sp.]|nr:isopentenyl-diphosphate Delta-isomerase [Puia sp.]